MTLRRRMLLHTGATAAGAVTVCVILAFGIAALRQDFGIALQANRQLRRVYEVGLHVASAKRWMAEEPARRDLAVTDLKRAVLALERPANPPDPGPGRGRSESATPTDWLPGAETSIARVRDALKDAAADLETDSANPARLTALDEALAALAALSAETRTTITARQASADLKHRAALLGAVCLSAATGCGAAYAGLRLYRGVMTPVDRLRNAVRRLAAGRRDERVPDRGDEEFGALARDFNRMADELDRVCSDLERRVADKTRELIRSERLASVGYLAAGVAHEINNPLGIIAGYGERSLQRLRRRTDPENVQRVEHALRVMCEEAFRCRGITDRLLALARPGDDRFDVVAVDDLARQVVSNIGALPQAAGRRITLETLCDEFPRAEAQGHLSVSGRAAELTQVLLNLMVNALDAVDAADGRVHVLVRRSGSRVELQVRDDGRGMTSEVLDRVFEPFYSERHDRQPGNGLGLCISQAIVHEHGGDIRAESAGPGRGSCFTVSLPAAGAAHVGPQPEPRARTQPESLSQPEGRPS